jgi:outer membrane protein assembly factor BamB
MKRLLVLCALGLALPCAALAVSTKSFVIDTSEAFEKGKLEGTASHAGGKLSASVTTARTAIEGVPVAFASAIGPDGAIYVGTGNEGKVFRVSEGSAKPFADTEGALVSSLVWVGSTLYAGTLPKGRIYAIDSAGKVKEHAALEGAEHVWALAHDAKSGTLYAATGPQGKLFALDKAGKAKVLHDDTAEHLLSLGLDAEGRVYAGTSNGARVVRVAQGKASVLYDFGGQEVTALSVGPAFVAVASNEFGEPPAAPSTPDSSKEATPPRLKRPKPGKGKVYALDFDGRAQELYSNDSSHVSALEVEKGAPAVHVGLAQDGRIVRVTRSGERAVWADADERQVVSIALGASAPHFVTSDGVAVYRTKPGKEPGLWTSDVLDAKVLARFGELVVRSKGGAVPWSTRSGNTETADDSWSPWSAESTQPGPIKSPAARFFQVRLKLSGAAEVYALTAYYLPQNQPARVRNVRPKVQKPDPKAPPSTNLVLTWDVDNPDDDKLRYRLFYRREEHEGGLPMLREHEVHESTEYSWDTKAIPDGFYRVRVEASDEPSNPDTFTEKTEALSAPILVDNHAPSLAELSVSQGKLKGRATDALGPVASLEVSVDAAPFRPVFPDDGLLDTASERFTVELGKLAPGRHIVAVRTSDAAHNVNAAELEFTTGP